MFTYGILEVKIIFVKSSPTRSLPGRLTKSLVLTKVGIKTDYFWANSALFQCAILAYNTLRWMALCSGNAILRRWQPATMRTYLVRMAGKWTSGARQQKLRVPERTLYNAQWDAWVAVGETWILCFTPVKTFC